MSMSGAASGSKFQRPTGHYSFRGPVGAVGKAHSSLCAHCFHSNIHNLPFADGAATKAKRSFKTVLYDRLGGLEIRQNDN